MGLFNRGSKSDVPLSGDEWSTNGHGAKRPQDADRSELERQPVPASEPEREPEPEVKTKPPVNPPEPQEGDDKRMSAEQALAPVRRPGMGRPPGAHIGDASERRAKIISFANQKGGVAKTTTTLNLAVAFAESGHDVLAVDLDPQGNLTMSQGIDPDKA